MILLHDSKSSLISLIPNWMTQLVVACKPKNREKKRGKKLQPFHSFRKSLCCFSDSVWIAEPLRVQCFLPPFQPLHVCLQDTCLSTTVATGDFWGLSDAQGLWSVAYEHWKMCMCERRGFFAQEGSGPNLISLLWGRWVTEREKNGEGKRMPTEIPLAVLQCRGLTLS